MEDLLLDLRERPQEGIKAVMQQYMGFCVTIVSGRLLDFPREDIEECVSDVFLEVYRCREKIQEEAGGLKGFIATLAHRKAVDRFRSLCRKENLPLEETIAAQEEGLSFESKTALSEAICRMGEPDGSILIWKYYFGYPTKEIAKAFGFKENAIDQKIHRGLKKLKVILEGGAFYEE